MLKLCTFSAEPMLCGDIIKNGGIFCVKFEVTSEVKTCVNESAERIRKIIEAQPTQKSISIHSRCTSSLPN